MNGSSILACQDRIGASPARPAGRDLGPPRGGRLRAAGTSERLLAASFQRRRNGDGGPAGRETPPVQIDDRPHTGSLNVPSRKLPSYSSCAGHGHGYLAARSAGLRVVAEMVAGFLMGRRVAFRLDQHRACRSRCSPARVASRPGHREPDRRRANHMFCVGLEFRSELMIRHARRAARRSRSPASPAPRALGGALAVLLMRSGGFFAPEVQTFHCSPVRWRRAVDHGVSGHLARIIYERGHRADTAQWARSRWRQARWTMRPHG